MALPNVCHPASRTDGQSVRSHLAQVGCGAVTYARIESSGEECRREGRKIGPERMAGLQWHMQEVSGEVGRRERAADKREKRGRHGSHRSHGQLHVVVGHGSQ